MNCYYPIPKYLIIGYLDPLDLLQCLQYSTSMPEAHVALLLQRKMFKKPVRGSMHYMHVRLWGVHRGPLTIENAGCLNITAQGSSFLVSLKTHVRVPETIRNKRAREAKGDKREPNALSPVRTVSPKPCFWLRFRGLHKPETLPQTLNSRLLSKP